jgi:hypothetical protein
MDIFLVWRRLAVLTKGLEYIQPPLAQQIDNLNTSITASSPHLSSWLPVFSHLASRTELNFRLLSLIRTMRLHTRWREADVTVLRAAVAGDERSRTCSSFFCFGHFMAVVEWCPSDGQGRVVGKDESFLHASCDLMDSDGSFGSARLLGIGRRFCEDRDMGGF